jgi:CDP-diacylglycerol--inositol 3-phosphatidyltransferase
MYQPVGVSFQKVLFAMCAGNELWFSMIYILHFNEGPTGNTKDPICDSLPFNHVFVVLTYGGYSIGLWRAVLYFITPIMTLKQMISFVHLYTAAVDIAAVDVAERSSKAKTQ